MAEPSGQPAQPGPDRFEEARLALERRWALIALTGKVPIHKGWQSRPSAKLSTVLGWVRSGHNLGLRTGQVSGIVVLDDDSKDGSASAALGLPKTVTAITGSGKKHYYFKVPDFKVGNSVRTLAPGIDVRGDGGQVVFVGSIHPNTQQPYAWAPGLSPDEIEVAALPDHLLDRLRPKAKSSAKPKPDLKIVGHDNDDRRARRIDAYVRATFDDEIDAILASSEGTRNDTLNKAAFNLGQLVGAGVIDHERVRLELRGAAGRIGLPDHEAERTIGSGLNAGLAQPRDLSKLDSGGDASSEPDAGHDQRPVIILHPGWIHTAVTKAQRILLRQQPQVVYQRGTSLVRVVSLPEAASGRSMRRKPLIYEFTNASVIDILTSLIRWERIDKRSGEVVAMDCPERLAKVLLSRPGQWILLPLVGVIDCPTLRRDGGILDNHGYDAKSGLYLALGDHEWLAVPTNPSKDDAVAALQKLLFLLKDFPFLTDADKSVAVAAILTVLIRPSLRTAPLFAFLAAKMGSGKSLLADILALIATGAPASVMSQGADENEDKKRMLPILAEGDPVAVFDNVERPFGSAALCSILTQEIWRDRVLGRSQTMALPTTNTTWCVTGNNVVFIGDITTRMLVCELDPCHEHPEERKFDVNLHQYIPLHRAEVVAAGLTVLRGYHVAGRPSMDLPVFGRFEEWSDWIRSSLVWLGLADPCETRRRVEATDPVREQLGGLLQVLQQQFSTQAFQVADVLAASRKCTPLDELLSPIMAAANAGQSGAQCLGHFLQRVQRRPEGGLRVVRESNLGGSARWRIERV